MIQSDLRAGGVRGAQLRESYRHCRDLNARHGRTYFLATRVLAPSQRPAVHALYGFARYADDILDDFDSGLDIEQRSERLEQLASQFFDGGDHLDHPVLAAVLHTARTYRLPPELFAEFLASMRMDLTVTDYPDRAALNRYVRGSAEVIGLQVLPVLGIVGPPSGAEPYAAALGTAFQLTNFLRDVDEDLARNRVYLPADELAQFGVDRELLRWCQRRRRITPQVRDALAHQHDITREMYQYARGGIPLLAPRSRPCVAAAFTLYSEILDQIKAMNFEVFAERAVVGKRRRLQVFSRCLLSACRARTLGRSPAEPARGSA